MTRICKLVPSKSRRNELCTLAYEFLARGEAMETAVAMLMREKRERWEVAAEVVLWTQYNSFVEWGGYKNKRIG